VIFRHVVITLQQSIIAAPFLIRAAIASMSSLGSIALLIDVVDPNLEVDHQGCLLHKAAVCGGVAAVTKLLKRPGINVNKCSLDGTSALMVAARSNRLDLCRLLLESGANPNLQNNDGDTALHQTERTAHDVILLLVRDGASSDVLNQSGITPYQMHNKVAMVGEGMIAAECHLQ
jgi:ankyrin repeat protein